MQQNQRGETIEKNQKNVNPRQQQVLHKTPIEAQTKNTTKQRKQDKSEDKHQLSYNR